MVSLFKSTAIRETQAKVYAKTKELLDPKERILVALNYYIQLNREHSAAVLFVYDKFNRESGNDAEENIFWLQALAEMLKRKNSVVATVCVDIALKSIKDYKEFAIRAYKEAAAAIKAQEADSKVDAEADSEASASISTSVSTEFSEGAMEVAVQTLSGWNMQAAKAEIIASVRKILQQSIGNRAEKIEAALSYYPVLGDHEHAISFTKAKLSQAPEKEKIYLYGLKQYLEKANSIKGLGCVLAVIEEFNLTLTPAEKVEAGKFARQIEENKQQRDHATLMAVRK